MANYDTLGNFLEQNPNSLNPNLIICDEAHNVTAATYEETVEDISKHETRVIGLTATPIRSGDPDPDDSETIHRSLFANHYPGCRHTTTRS